MSIPGALATRAFVVVTVSYRGLSSLGVLRLHAMRVQAAKATPMNSRLSMDRLLSRRGRNARERRSSAPADANQCIRRAARTLGWRLSSQHEAEGRDPARAELLPQPFGLRWGCDEARDDVRGPF